MSGDHHPREEPLRLDIRAQRQKAQVPLNEHAQEWRVLLDYLEQKFAKKPDMNGVLFLVGLNVLGLGPDDFTKEQKQDIMHIGICELLSFAEFYEFKGRDKQGWPHYSLLRSPQGMSLAEQEAVLRSCAVQYFRETETDFNFIA
jgi:hypothetical protein